MLPTLSIDANVQLPETAKKKMRVTARSLVLYLYIQSLPCPDE